MYKLVDRPPPMANAVILFIGALIAALVTWAAFAEVDEITRGEGRVIPASKTQIVQASEPGVVQEIAVKVGQIVHKGDLIVSLDNTTNVSSLGELEAKARALSARIARLKLEQSGKLDARLECPQVVRQKAPEVCENEEKLLAARQDNFRNKLLVLQSRQQQRQNELGEATANLTRLKESLEINSKQLDLVSSMVKRGLMAQTELMRTQAENAEFKGQIKVGSESIARLEAAVQEADLQVNELPLELQQEALDELTQSLADLSVVEETIRGASDKVKRTEIRSPVDGIINTLDVNTIGAFVQPGATVAGVVPTSETLLVEARVSPKDVAFIQPNQHALIKITAYDFSIFGGINGKVANVSADSLIDSNTGETFYQVRVTTDQAALVSKGKSYAIIPGMVCSVEIMTGRKTILHYLLKPFNKAREEALRER
ncbi:HlyD family type I secretion periplasmic adaptor subunit [Mesorhizobium sp. BAC0120]|uniref:HlyD family type I secretion periplasmic adaptor subunit n=1 Tax=Mesorhizobium sp. BAC0120 TaxID=3090670 RepID=UPI00298C9600|nr:HlyD family type I secretion periplasmic adaptor subunit [Mesorhizobium sp. BAC0120]MDW6026546.1 HlyD family type I secretion periplasmic adaptor subunit [Mesorhizobium sp. BAC0120]